MATPHFRRGHLSPEEQQKLLTEIGTQLLAEAPQDWTFPARTCAQRLAGAGARRRQAYAS